MVARCPKASALAENMFNECRDHAGLQKAGKFGRISRWHHVCQSHLMEDNDHRNVTITPQDRDEAPNRLPKTMFEVRKVDMELPEYFEKQLTATIGREWVSWKPDLLWQVAEANLLLIKDMATLGNLKIAWLNLLVEPSTLICHKGVNGEWGIVLYTSAFGIKVFKPPMHRVGDLRFFELGRVDVNTEFLKSFCVHTTLMEWQVAELEAVALAQVARRVRVVGGTGIGMHRAMLVAKTARAPLLTWAAKRAFYTLTLDQLKMFARTECGPLPRPRPKSDFD